MGAATYVDKILKPKQAAARGVLGRRTVDEMGHSAILYTFDDEQLTQGQ